MKKELLTLFCVAGISFPALGGTYNIAPKARATASSSLNADGDASKVNDGYIRLDNAGEWVSAAQMPYWQQLPYPWIRLDWDEEVTLSRIVLRRPADGRCAYGRRRPLFQRRHTYRSSRDPGQPRWSPRSWNSRPNGSDGVKFEVNDAVGSHVGLSEIEAFPPAGAGGDFVSQVNPFIENDQGALFLHHGQPAVRHDRRRTAAPQPQPVRRGLQRQFDRGARLPADTQLGAGRALRSCRRPATSIPPSAKGTGNRTSGTRAKSPSRVTTASSWRITASGSSRRPLTARGSTA